MSAAIPHILVIDDNDAILDSVAMILRWNALRVTTSNKMDDFMHEVNVLQPDLVLLDKALGWADGSQLCFTLKSAVTTQHIPVIMLSAVPQAKQVCVDAGADAFLEKPFDMGELMKLVGAFTTTMQIQI